MTTGKLIILRGLPCSRKSTWARDLVRENPEQAMRVNRDDLREMLHNGQYIKGSKDNVGTEQTVIQMEHAMVRRGLRAGLTVISDGTNLPNRSVKALVEIAEPLGAEWEVKDFTDIPLETVLKWNAQRNRKRSWIGGMPPEDSGLVLDDTVIIDMHNRFVKGKPYPLPFEYSAKPELTVEPYVPNDLKPVTVICDIDGTVALMEGQRTPHEYDKVSLDKPNWPVINLVKLLRQEGYQVVFLSGRKDSCRDDTVQWIKDYIFYDGDFRLLMRKHEDNRVDSTVKLELFNEFIRDDFNVKLVLDDRDQVVQMWRSLGLTCLQVAEGAF